MPNFEEALLGLPGNRARELAAELHAMRTALECVTPGASSDVIHGRIDSLVQERRVELQALCAEALTTTPEAAHGQANA